MEDNVHDARVFRRALERGGMNADVKRLTRAEDALDLLLREPDRFDIVVTDYNLPGMNGLDLCRAIIADENRAALVLVTGSGTERTAVEALRLGVDHYIIKDTGDVFMMLLPITLMEVIRKRVDRTARMEAERALRESGERFRQLYEHAPNAYCAVDIADGSLIMFNNRLSELLGYDREELRKLRIFDFYADAPEGKARARDMFKDFGAGRPIENAELIMRRKDGSPLWVQLSVNPVFNEDGEVVEGRSIITDITALKAAEEKIRHLASHDSLTNLPNRALMMDRLTVHLAAAQRHRTKLALLFTDLNGFKRLNDTLGHDAGDKALCIVAERMAACVRKSDTVARYGGDEFAVILDDIASEAAALFTAHKLVEAITDPFEVRGAMARLGIAVGVALHPEHGDTPDDLLHQADDAMYEAKAAGGDSIRVAREIRDQRQR